MLGSRINLCRTTLNRLYRIKHPPHHGARYLSAVQKQVEAYKPGDVLHQFKVEQVQEVQELALTAVRLRHIDTGAEYLHIARDDQNNVFCIGFRTTPMDSTGVAHILEHTVLCGSRRFPVRDPFFLMLSRSLATFMNAMTGSDYTIYPFSTQNPTDFRNLMSVYLDAVLHPNLSRLDFLQEAWRLEHENPQDASSPIIIKGVVYNEMKGVYGDREQQLMRKLQSTLLPSHTYGNCSGGDPQCIPELTHDNLKMFHKDHYHPSNSRIYTYGSFPLEDHLSFIHENFLKEFKRNEADTEVATEPRWTEPRRAVLLGPPDPLAADPNRQTTIAVAYLHEKVTDVFQSFVLQILSELLLSGPNAPFYKSLLERNLGSGFSQVTGYWGHLKENSFAVGLQGISKDDVDKVADIIKATFVEVAQTGFPFERIQAVIHKVELAYKHEKSNFGLDLIMGLTSMWNHGGNPIRALQINKMIARFWDALEDNPNFLQDQIKRYFVDNAHKAVVVMNPEEEYETKLREKESELIQSKLKNLGDEDKRKLYEEGLKLKETQSAKHNVSVLPTLAVSDISPEVTRWTLSDAQTFGVPFQYTQQPTNGLTYFRAIFNTSAISDNLRPYIPLFCDVITKMGAGNMDYREMDQRIELKTGGLNVDTLVVDNPYESGSYSENVLISSHCLDQNVPEMFDLWSDILRGVSLYDQERLKTLVRESASELSNSVVYSGHTYAMRKALDCLSQSARLRERFGGLDNVLRMKELASQEDVEELLEKLKLLACEVFQRRRMAVAVNTGLEKENLGLTSNLIRLLALMADNRDREALEMEAFVIERKKTHYVLPVPVNFSSLGFATVPYSHQDAPCLRVLARLLTFKYLHGEIREKGGAYGGGASAAPEGYFSFYSYRDPRGIDTFDVYEKSIEWAIRGEFSDRDVNEAKLSVFQNEDKPVPPGSRGMEQFLLGRSDDSEQEHRTRLRSCTSGDLRRVAQQYLTNSTHGACLLGPEPTGRSLPDPWTTCSLD